MQHEPARRKSLLTSPEALAPVVASICDIKIAVRFRSPPKKSRFARLFIKIILLLMLGGGGWAAWTYIVQPPPENSLVVLRADPTPFRVKPADGTQATIPNQDSTFMNLIDGNAEANQNSELISLSIIFIPICFAKLKYLESCFELIIKVDIS